MGESTFQKAYDELDRISQDKEMRARALSRDMFLLDQAMYRQDAREEGLAEGRKEGREEGREEGKEEGREECKEEGREEGLAEGIEKGIEKGLEKGMEKGKTEFVKLLHANGSSSSEIAALLGLPVLTIEQYLSSKEN